MKKRLFVLLVAAILLFGCTVDALALSGSRANRWDFGSTDGGTKSDPWRLNKAGSVTAYVQNEILYINGSGEMEYVQTAITIVADHSRNYDGVEISEGVTAISELAFMGRWITYVAIPSSVTKIGYDAFEFCDSLSKVYYGGSEEQWSAITVGSGNEELTGAEIEFNCSPGGAEERKPKGIRLAGSEDYLTVGTLLKPGDKVDFSEYESGGAIKYAIPAAYGVKSYEIKGTELTVESHAALDPAVTQWKITEIDLASGSVTLAPVSYARGFSVGREGVDGKTCIPVNAEISFPSTGRTGTVKYYSNKSAGTPFYTETVSGGKASVTAPQGSPADIQVWLVRALDIPANAIELYPYDDNGGTYDLINYVSARSEVDFGRLSKGMVIERGVTLTSDGSLNGRFAVTYKGFGDDLKSGYLNTLTVAPEGALADVRYWLVDFPSNTLRHIYLTALPDMSPQFNKLISELAEGEKLLPWQIGKDESDVRAYIENGTLYIEGDGRMQNFEIEKAPWYSRADEIRSISFSGKLKSIGSYAFYDLYNLTGVTLPETLETIGDQAFLLCTNLTGIRFPDSVKRIGADAFCYCWKLQSVDFGSGIETIERYAFYDDSAVTSCTYRGSQSAWKKLSIGEGNDALAAAQFSFTASVIGEGNVALAIGIGAVAVAAMVLVIVRKKKTAAK